MGNEFVRKVERQEQYKHGCEDCIHASVYEEMKKKNSTILGIRSHSNLMCKFESCPYADILDKYKSYIYYIADGFYYFDKFVSKKGD